MTPPISSTHASSASSQRMISVLLVDDDHRFRKGLTTLLGFYSHTGSYQFKIVGEAASMDQALSLVVEQHPQIVLLDLELAQGDGVMTLVHLGEMAYRGKVMVLSAHREEEWVFRAMQAGACGYVLKDHLATQLCQAITTVLNDEVFLPPEVAAPFFRMFHFYSGNSFQVSQTVYLTEREREVLHWLVQGASNEAIAGRLFITVATVKAHLTAIFEKLEVKSRTQAIVKALKLGLV